MPDVGADERQYGRLYPVARAILSPIFHAAWRIHVRGAENLPGAGPAILCPNHTSVIDSFLLPSTLPRRITFVGKAEYLDDWKTKHLFPALGMIPIDRSGGDASKRALDAAAGVLERGELFGIYPEGTRSRPCEIRIGRPIDVGHYTDRPDDRLVLRQLTDELMYEIRELSGQDYVDEYATRKPDAMPSQPTAIVVVGNGDAARTGVTAGSLSGVATT